MMFAYLMLRPDPQYRRDAFAEGLRAAGYQVMGTPRLGPLNPSDVLVIWNRYGRFHSHAECFEKQGARVVVAENGALGRDAFGGPWYSIALTNPVAAGVWPAGSPTRWKSFGVEICEWRNPGREFIILAQRGIGPNGVREPDGWHRRVAEKLVRLGHRVRIRKHPGENRPPVSLIDDLQDARAVVTWASGAAFKSLLLGVPVLYGCEKWVGREAGTPLMENTAGDLLIRRPERLPTFQRLAWSMWRIPEIAAGLPFKHLLSASSESGATTAAT